jgi:acetate kinase
VACFDTAFHRTIPEAARTYALPARLRRLVQGYGFHGLSHAWAAARATEAAPGARRLLVAHLGGGQSLCGVLDGASVVTTMGFTPLDGLVMATRSGALDPGAVLWLARHTDEDLAEVLERESGLLGLAGTADMAEVLARRAAGDEAATLAVDVWRHRLVTQAGACVAALGGLDVMVFTGGIGEHSAEARALVTERLAWLGAEVLVVESREDLRMAAEAEALLSP